MNVMKWKDGTDMICDKCGEPIYESQSVLATITHNIKKRHASHYFCDGGTMTVIGSPEPGVVEITQYGKTPKKGCHEDNA